MNVVKDWRPFFVLIGQSAIVATVVVAEGSAGNTIAIMVCDVSVRTTGDEAGGR